MPRTAFAAPVIEPRSLPRCRPRGRRQRARADWLLTLVLLSGGWPLAAQQTPLQMVNAVVHNEQKAHATRNLFRYTSKERSSRTGGHLWEEKVVETPDGPLRRLIAEDGKPLSADRAAAEDRRIAALVADPNAFRSSNADRRADEARIARLLEILPKAVLLSPDGTQDGCTRIAYRPNPDYVPATYDERVVHGLAGTVLIHTPDMRLCGMDGHLVERISFGYGLLGHIEKDSHFSTTRKLVTTTDWKTSHTSVHMDGKILLLKSFSRDQDSVHMDAQPIPTHLSLAQVAALTRP